MALDMNLDRHATEINTQIKRLMSKIDQSLLLLNQELYTDGDLAKPIATYLSTSVLACGAPRMNETASSFSS
ncbi:hypothetical protein G5I_09571 [Acromyrmex echinatior]|uniref:Uncharacterized protein n=1 Tax=Acromyrmex echinatior TaxID=103372 RepID=F4WUK0_ACREC|nr:hypothetical protein G5I_09571 [Acromyrmex echinatior]